MIEDTTIDTEKHPMEGESVSEREGADISAEAVENLAACITAEGDYREEAIQDLEFRIGKQWPIHILNARAISKQPCLQFNLIPKFVRQVTGDGRQNVPGINIVPENSLASIEVAEILKGVVRYIEHSSKASYVYSKGLDQSASCGRGWWRVDTEYSDDESFDQDIFIRPIQNALSVYVDPNAVGPTYQNAEWYVIRQWINKKTFERKFPGKTGQPEALSNGVGDYKDWFNEDSVCVAEYWRKEPVEDELLELQVFPTRQEGDTVEPESYKVVITKQEMLAKFANINVVVLRKRKITSPKVVRYLITGYEVLERTEWPSKFIPIVPVIGEEFNVDGKEHLSGIIRDMKDPQRAYNYWMTMLTEQVALAPKVPWIVSDFMIEPYKQEWDNMNEANYPYIRFRSDPAHPTGPQRPQPAGIASGYSQMMQICQGALNDTSGIFKPALGQESNETSGRAILARQKEGDTGSYVYIANWLLAVQFTGEIIVDLVPKIFDTERVLMILDEKGDMSSVPVNQPFGAKIYDLRQGKYGVRVTSGPSYSTKRSEAANSMLEFVRIYPDAAPVIGDKLARMMDWEGSEEIADRLEQLAMRNGILTAPPQPGVAPGSIPQAPGTAPNAAPVAGPAAQEANIDQLMMQNGSQTPVV